MTTPLPEGISQQAWDEAEVEASVYLVWLGPDATKHEADAHHVLTYSIARAIMAATERERARLADHLEAVANARMKQSLGAKSIKLRTEARDYETMAMQARQDANDIRGVNDNFRAVPHNGQIA